MALRPGSEVLVRVLCNNDASGIRPLEIASCLRRYNGKIASAHRHNLDVEGCSVVVVVVMPVVDQYSNALSINARLCDFWLGTKNTDASQPERVIVPRSGRIHLPLDQLDALCMRYSVFGISGAPVDESVAHPHLQFVRAI